MKPKAPSVPQRKTRIFALVLGILLAALVAFCVVFGYHLNPQDATIAYVLVGFVLVGGPLLLLLLISTFYVRWKSGGWAGLGKPWWLVLAASLTLPLLLIKGELEEKWFLYQHPNLTEYHINLSGRSIAVNKGWGLGPDKPETFLEVYRSAERDKPEAWQNNYVHGELAPGFTRMTVVGADGAPIDLPLVVSGGPADVAAVRGPFHTPDTIRPAFLYYHYADRIEVAYSFEQTYEGTYKDFVYPHNLGTLPIVRLEIDGKTVSLEKAVHPLRPGACKIARRLMVELPKTPVKVRWQYAQANPVWHEALLTVPAYASQAKNGGASNDLHLYLMPDGKAAAQRAQQLEVDNVMRRIRVSAVLPALAVAPACGFAQDLPYQDKR